MSAAVFAACRALTHGRAQNSFYVIAAVLLGWWLNSLIVFVIPIDVSSSMYLACVKVD